MLNEVVISGNVEVVKDLGDTQLALIRCNADAYYIFWKTEEYDTSDILKKYVCVKGYLQHIRYKLESNVNATNILAICVEEMEECEV